MNKNVRRLTDGAMMIAITAVFLLLDRALANTLTYYLMFLMPLPMVFYGTKYGWKGSWVVYAALLLVSFVVTTPQYIFYVAAEGFLGMVYGCGIYNKRPQNQLVVGAMVIGAIVVKVEDRGWDAVFPDSEQKQRFIPFTLLPDSETALAITVHKSQGSEFTHTLMVTPSEYNRVLTKELLYTGITRARKWLTLIGTKDVIVHAAGEETRRSSCLRERLMEREEFSFC